MSVKQYVLTWISAPGTKLNRRCETPNLMMIVNTGKQNKDGSQHKDTSKKVNRTSSIYAHDNCDSLRGNWDAAEVHVTMKLINNIKIKHKLYVNWLELLVGLDLITGEQMPEMFASREPADGREISNTVAPLDTASTRAGSSTRLPYTLQPPVTASARAGSTTRLPYTLQPPVTASTRAGSSTRLPYTLQPPVTASTRAGSTTRLPYTLQPPVTASTRAGSSTHLPYTLQPPVNYCFSSQTFLLCILHFSS